MSANDPHAALPVTGELFDQLPVARQCCRLAEGAWLLRGWAADRAAQLQADIARVAAQAGFRHLHTPGGLCMSVAMTNCGRVGWHSDRRGYRYVHADPQTGKPWPAMPDSFRVLARAAAQRAGYPGYEPDVALINRYQPGARLSLHQDKDEGRFDQPIVSVSLGVTARFLFGGLARRDRCQRIALGHGDVVVWGGPSRKVYHGIAPLAEQHHPETGKLRYNLTFRVA